MKIYPIFITVALVLAFGRVNAKAQTNFFVSSCDNVQTQIVTLLTTTYTTASYNLSTNQIVIVSSFTTNITGLTLYAKFYNGLTGYLVSGEMATGATNVFLSPSGGGIGIVTLTVLTPSTNSVSVTPVNSVVIPSDATGPVQIVLESSSDLVNWTSSLPGTYGSTYSNRFFRVRAIVQ
jgi:hypothetical protein